MVKFGTCKIKKNSLSLRDPLLTAKEKGGNDNSEIFDLLRSSLENNGFIDYMQHHLENPSDEREVDTNMENSFYHAVWVTNPDNPKGLDENLDNFIIQSKKLPNYKSIIWTNIDKDSLLELSPKLENTAITIKHISEIDTRYKGLLEVALNPKEYISSEVGRNHNPYIVDLVKELVIESNGGVLADLNFKFGT